MEKQLKIPLGDNKFTYGTLRGDVNSPLLIFVHGFTGYKDEHIFFNGARFFKEQKLSSFRFNLYGEEKDARKLNECTLSLHGKDLDTVVSYFKNKKTPQIIVVGHSFGGVTILLSKKQKFDKAVLWDPTGNPKELTSKAIYVKELDLYYFKEWGVGFTIGKEMFEENKKLNTLNLVKQLQVPIKIIVAGGGELVNFGKKYYEVTNEPKAFASIPGATHTFGEDGVEERLFQETLKWIK